MNQSKSYKGLFSPIAKIISQGGLANAVFLGRKCDLLMLILVFAYHSGKCQMTAAEVRIPDYMQNEMKYLESQERSLKDTVDGLGSIYDSTRQKAQLEIIDKQRQELLRKIKDYQENRFKQILAHRKFQAQFVKSIATPISKFKLHSVYKNVRFSQKGEVFPELTVLDYDGILRTIKVRTSMGLTEFLKTSSQIVYLAK